jgi:hypothetical protein
MHKKSKVLVFLACGVVLVAVLAGGIVSVLGLGKSAAGQEDWQALVARIANPVTTASFVDFHGCPLEMKALAETTPADIREMIEAALSTESSSEKTLLVDLLVWRLQVDMGTLNLAAYHENQVEMDRRIAEDGQAKRNMDLHVLAWNAEQLEATAESVLHAGGAVSEQLAELVPYGFLALPLVVDQWKATGDDAYLTFVSDLLVSEDLGVRSTAWTEGDAASRSADPATGFRASRWVASHAEEIEGYRSLLEGVEGFPAA